MHRARSLLLLLVLVTVAPPPSAAADGDWADVLAQAIPSIVTIRMDRVRAFDTDKRGTSVATGFVVDAERGLILTNRHVVSAGPITATAVFQNNEEVRLRVVYRDPVHDFGLFGYDPASLRHNQPVPLPLSPEGARVGEQIRVVGNDSAEKLSIHDSTLARLDRPAPIYGTDRYNDFNTEYIQAASGTSGGSSGSPVLNQRGQVVGLNGGSRNGDSNIAFYLPLDRPQRALSIIQQGGRVTRGGLHATFVHRTFDELERAGLPPEVETTVRAEPGDRVGLLAVERVTPGGPAAGLLRPGDVLLSIAGEPVRRAFDVDRILDARVGEEIQVTLVRGSETLNPSMQVADLFEHTPSTFLEHANSVINPLSYQRARTRNVAPGLPQIAEAGWTFLAAGLRRGNLILAVNGEPTPDLDTLEAVLATIPDGATVSLRRSRIEEPTSTDVVALRIDRSWYPTRRCTWDSSSGRWPCTSPVDGPRPEPVEPVAVTPLASADRVTARVAASLVQVKVRMPFNLMGSTGTGGSGTGLVVDAERGLVVVDRVTLPTAVADIRVIVGGAVEIPARPVFLHPQNGLAVIAYDPGLLAGAPLRSADLSGGPPLAVGDPVLAVGLDGKSKLVSRRSRVAQIEEYSLPRTRPPRFKVTNTELVSLEDEPSDLRAGVLADRKGRISAFWERVSWDRGKERTTFSGGASAAMVAEITLRAAAALDAGALPAPVPALGAELDSVSIAQARKLGLDADGAERLLEGNKGRRVLAVQRPHADQPAAELLLPGDLLLSIDGTTVFDRRQVRALVAQAASRGPEATADLEVFREGLRQTVQLPLAWLDAFGPTRFLSFAGIVTHEPHPPLARQWGMTDAAPYVSVYFSGSPAHRARVYASSQLLEVDGAPVQSVDDLLATLRPRRSGDTVRVRRRNVDRYEAVAGIVLDLDAWPTWVLAYDVATGRWIREDVTGSEQ